MTQWNIFMAFFRSGMLGFGGGPASIPLIQKEVVEKYNWMTEEEFGDMLAIANTLPGPIATKLAGYVGYRISGFIGMLNAVIASIFPTILLMIFLLTSLSTFKEFDWVRGMTAAVVPVVGMMMAVLTWGFVKKAGKGFGWEKAFIIGGILFVALQLLHIHPGIIIAALLIIALTLSDKTNVRNNSEGKS
ncbi:chromate transporter [Oceanobacillus sp. 143]|uniref:Chromate transporter n=1 Tax=Oceanobacillus zhaokaii TaxID=2052660 RepID=A0A345PJE3_9BACI|nr:chromate transporter [Oceanobacillus zhaokaii]AXI10123.1 chromate transporter [Oceanobacillus zhaokaii]QGS69248.1 chromate transporter [Oceanobacillus sp. 143]